MTVTTVTANIIMSHRRSPTATVTESPEFIDSDSGPPRPQWLRHYPSESSDDDNHDSDSLDVTITAHGLSANLKSPP